MTLKKKPQVDDFIAGAKADLSVIPVPSAETSDKEETKEDTKAPVPVEKKTKLTFYMTPDMGIAWTEYVLKQQKAGEKKPSFQGVVEAYLKDLLGML